MEKRTVQKLGLLCASVALCSAASWWSGNGDTDQQVQKLAEQPVVEQVQEIKITVCVSGAVVKPGLYEVAKGSRAQQVIELAGGVTEEADMDKVNLAQLCKDGGHIKVPRLSKARLMQKMQERKLAMGADISGEMIGEGRSDEQKKSMEEPTPVHLNSATEAELIRLPGLGKATARQIVMFRNKKAFQKLEDIMQVPGIGPAKFEKMRPYLVL